MNRAPTLARVTGYRVGISGRFVGSQEGRGTGRASARSVVLLAANLADLPTQTRVPDSIILERTEPAGYPGGEPTGRGNVGRINVTEVSN